MKRRSLIHRLACTILVCTLGVIAQSTTAMAASNTALAEDHVNHMIGDMQGLLMTDDGDLEARTAAVTQLLDTYFDFPGITRFSAGQYWRAASDAEKQEYATIIRDVIIGTVVRNFDQLRGLSYTPKASKAKGEKLVLVTGEFSDVKDERPSVMVNWRVTTLPGKPVKVLDIEIENISMLVTQKQENIAIIRKNKGEFAALITAMKEKLAD